MDDSDREYLSKFALDPAIEYGGEDLSATDFAYDEALDPYDDKKSLDAEDLILEDDFLFED